MLKKQIKKISILLVIFTFLVFSQPVYAENGNSGDEKTQQLLAETIKNKIKRGAFFVLGIDEKLKSNREELKILKNNIKSLEKKMDETSTDIEDLQSQLKNFDRLIALNQAKITAIKLQIARAKNAIETLEGDINQQKQILAQQNKSLDKTLFAYYAQTNSFFDFGDGDPILLAFLSSDQTTGEILQQNNYLFFLQNATQELAQNMLQNQLDLMNKQTELDDKKDTLTRLQEILNREQQILLQAREAKENLLAQTQGKQIIYQTLLELSKQEEEQVALQIEMLKENYAFFSAKLEELKVNAPQSGSVDFDKLSLEDSDNPLLKGDKQLAWPVSPALGITAFFHDADYQKALGVQHNAIDIRLAQGSKVKAAADGIVTKVADNSFAYSYIIIAHPNNIVTLYGHMSEMLVTEGEVVRQGQTIGLSGGIPGTRGAGWLTTGAHLHFEVFNNFKNADPLEYLALEFIPVESLPEKYIDQLSGEETVKVPRK